MNQAFIKAPKSMFKNSRFSSDAKVVYSLILDRLSLSQKNGWKDENGRTYVIYPISEIALALGCSKPKASKVLSELKGLIVKKRQGLCKPDIIYVNENNSTESAEIDSAEIFDRNSNSETYEEPHGELLNENSVNSGNNIQETQEDKNIAPNNNNINKNNLNNNNFNNLSNQINQYDVIDHRNEYIKTIKSNTDYEYLSSNYRKAIIDDIISVMTNAVCSTKEFIKIGGEEIPAFLVKEKLLKLDSSHIEYVYNCITQNKTRVKNMSAYLLACLYNAGDVISVHYANMVRCDMG